MSVRSSTTDTLVLTMAEDAYLGDAQFLVTVDGIQIGGTQTVTAKRALGQSQVFRIKGDFGTGPHVVAVTFLNDAFGGTAATDRNLYFDAVKLDGVTTAINANVGITTAIDVAAAAPPQATDTLGVTVSEDAWKGNAQFLILVDGVAVGGTQTATALHHAGASQLVTVTGDFGAGPHDVMIQFINDAYGGTTTTDRNLYVTSVVYDGTTTALQQILYSDGRSQAVTVSNVATVSRGSVDTVAAAPPPLPIVDTLVLFVSEDSYHGDAEFSVTVDGVAVGGVQTATGSHTAGDTQAITLTGAFGTGTHSVAITFLNDASGGSYLLDRNLYVSGIDYNRVYTGVDASLFWTGAVSTTIVGAGTPVAAPTPIVVTPPGTLQLVGVNLSGLEFGGPALPGILNTDYVEPTHAEIDYYASEGMNVIRLPFDWERLQPVQGGPLDKTYLALLDNVVDYAASKGIKVDLDVHNYGVAYGNAIGSAGTPDSSFNNLWSQLATHYAGSSNVMFGLMNEPYQQTATQWLTAANGAIAAIRSAGATQEILVSGTHVDGGSSWTTTDNASVMDGVVDPGMNFAFEIHQYLDADGSGTATSVVSPTIGVERLTAVTQWAQATGNHLFLGEFGSGSDAASLTATQNMLTYMAQNTDVWQGATEWGGGPWWGNYGFATDPTNGVSTKQISLLQAYTPTAAAHV